jgi:hypothetical protein
MRLKRNYLIKFLLIALVISASSCEEEDYPLLLDNNQQASLGELESLEISSGNNRVLIEGVVKDPNVSEVRIFWNDRSNSIVVPVSGSAEADTIREVIDDLEEKLYIFEAQTFDDAGNSSKIVSAGAEVFGSSFANNAGNRQVVSSALRNSLLEVTYSLADRSSGIIGTEFLYEKASGEEHELFLEPEQNSLSIPDFKSGSSFSYRTLYIPSLMAIDTVYTDYDEYTPIALPQLKNASAPFEAAEASGRWGTLAEWNTNEAIKNHGGYGGWDANNGFNVESGWGAPAIVNGKIYQTVTAAAANFTLHVEFNAHNHSEEDEGGYYIVVAKGDGLPDVENLATAPEVLGYERVIGGVMSYSVEFTVDDDMTEISVGIVTTQDDSGRYGPINSFEIGPGTD